MLMTVNQRVLGSSRAGFWNNIFYSDKRNEAMLLAGKNGGFEKTEEGWRISRSIPVEARHVHWYFCC